MSDYTAEFERWWSNYPNRRKRGKGDAFKSFQRDKLGQKVNELIAVLQNQIENDEHFKQYTPMPATYLNQKRYDDHVPKPKRYMPTPKEEEIPGETDPYVKSVKRVAVNWLMRRRGAIPDHKVQKTLELIHSLAQDARELHERGELTDAFAKTIREDLEEMVRR